MPAEENAARHEDLLEHLEWVRDLARALAREPGTSEDLSQEAWVVALSGGRPGRASLRSWLAGVVRNLARQAHRNRSRRAEVEVGAEPLEDAPDTSEVVQRIAVQRRVLAGVQALPAPYREVLFLNYYERLPHAEIALRTRAPITTVRVRLRRGLERLRRELDRELGPRAQAWLMLVAGERGAERAPMAFRPVSILRWSTAGAALILGGAWVAIESSSSSAPRAAAVTVTGDPSPGSPSSAAAGLALDRDGAGAPARTSVTGPDSPDPPGQAVSAAEETPPRATVHLSGRVLDLRREPVAGASVAFFPDGAEELTAKSALALAYSDHQGRFAIDVPPGSGRLVPQAEDCTRVLSRTVGEGTVSDIVVVLAPVRVLAGVVRDEDGQPIAGARVRFLFDRDPRLLFPIDLQYTEPREWQTYSDARGRFRLPDAPEWDEGVLSVGRAGYFKERMPLAELSAGEQLVTLRPIEGSEEIFTGRVLDPAGEVIRGAWVSLGESVSQTDESGSFQIDVEGERNLARLVAVASGWMPKVVPFETLVEAGRRVPSAPVDVVLERRALSLGGRVVDAAGSPLPGARLWRLEGTTFGWYLHDQGPWTTRLYVDAEQLSGDRPDRNKVTADESGRFLLPGLTARSYRIAACDPRTLALSISGPVAAGSEDVQLVLDEGPALAPLEGRVVNSAGQPLAGVEVRPVRLLQASEVSPVLAPRTYGTGTVTDELGRFSFESLARDRLVLDVPVQERYFREAVQVPRGLEWAELTLTLRCDLRIELDPGGPHCDAFSLLDGSGQPLALLRRDGPVEHWMARETLFDRRSQVVTASENARTLVLFDGERELTRFPVRLEPGRLTVLP